MSKQGKRAGAKAPARPSVSAHPAFPAIVALWFAALFGIGSLVLPVALYERTAAATGLASIWTAAQAPLGITARILIALVAAALGAGIGTEIARKVAASAPRPASRRAATITAPGASAEPRAKRPISAHEELGPDGLDADAEIDDFEPMPGRRRALAVTDESARSEFLDFAPLPGQPEALEPAPVALDLGAFAADDAEPDPSAQQDERFGSSSLGAPPADAPLPAPTEGAAQDPDEVAPMTAFEAAPAFEPRPAAADPFAMPSQHGSSRPAIAELVDRFARALETHRATAAVAAAPVAAELLNEAPVEPPAAWEERAPAAPLLADPVVPLALRPIAFDDEQDGEEGLPDLDLTAALSRAPRPFAGPTGEPAPQTFVGQTFEPAEDETDEFTDDAGDDAGGDAYSSLLAMKNPAWLPREAVRIDDEPASGPFGEDDGLADVVEPVVVFPGQAARQSAPPAPTRPFDAPQHRIDAFERGDFSGGQPAPRAHGGDTERALREALEKLQKMSGAA